EGMRFDLVVCCEVLEHMPYEQFGPNLNHLRKFGDRLFITLPNYRAPIGFGGFFRLPRFSAALLDLSFELPGAKRLDAAHFWEVGPTRQTSKRMIIKELQSRFKRVKSKRFALNPYHTAFYGS